MFLKKVMYYFLLSVMMISCNNSDSANTEKDVSISNKKDDLIQLIPQPLFNKNQMNSGIINLCINFKSLKGSDRKHIFERLQDLLPSCRDEENAIQVMSPFDLMEILGEPKEVRADNSIVYSLMSDDSYLVVFSCSEIGTVVCRSFEALG
jgi:hypothetical protein